MYLPSRPSLSLILVTQARELGLKAFLNSYEITSQSLAIAPLAFR